MRVWRSVERLAAADPGNAGWQRDLSVSYDRVGDVLVAQGNLPEALKTFREGLAISERLAAADPGNAGWQRDLSVSNNKVGDVLVAQGNLPEALKRSVRVWRSVSVLRLRTLGTRVGSATCRCRTTRWVTFWLRRGIFLRL